MNNIDEIKEYTYKITFKNQDTFHWIEERQVSEIKDVLSEDDFKFEIKNKESEETLPENVQHILGKYKGVCNLFGVEHGRLIDRELFSKEEQEGKQDVADFEEDFAIVEVGLWPTKEEDETLASVILTSDELEAEETDADRGITDPLDLLKSVVDAYQQLYDQESENDDGICENKNLTIAKAQLNAVQYAYKYVKNKGTLPNLPW